MKDYTKANQKKSNYSINNLKDKFKDLMETITESQTPEQKIMEAIYHLPPSKQLRTLEKLSMKIRKENSIRINKDVEITKNKYPKVR